MDFPDRGPAAFTVTTATLALATVFVVARMICRIGIVRRVHYDDYLICVAWLLAFFICFTIDFGAAKGLGRHDADISPDGRPALKQAQYVFSVLYNPALMAAKTSILVFYLRLAGQAQKLLTLGSWIVLVIVNLNGTILTLMNIFQCRPIAAAWRVTSSGDEAQCIPLLTEFICSAPINIVTDLAIIAMPIPVLTSMRLPRREKTILVITFALGFFVTIVDVVRIYYLQQAITQVPVTTSTDHDSFYGNSPDFSWNASLSLMWSAVEVNVSMTCACVPTLKPLIMRILPSVLVDGGRKLSLTPSISRTPSNRSNRDSPSDTNSNDAGRPPPAIEAHASFRRGGVSGASRDFLEVPSSAAPAYPKRASTDIISLPDFLTSTPPDMERAARSRDDPYRGSFDFRAYAATPFRARRPSSSPPPLIFEFVNLSKPKNMLKATAAESFRYCTLVTILFFLWGFSYGLLNTLNTVITSVAHMSAPYTLGLSTAYFGGGYFLGPLLVGEWILRHDEHKRTRRHRPSQIDAIGGFKTTFICGLLIYGTGTIMFWPSAVLMAYGGFMVSYFVVGFGLAVLETAANPFLILCGPAEYAEMRLLLAQGVQAVSAVISAVLAQRAFFLPRIRESEPWNAESLLDVQWTYLAITLFCVLLAFLFYYMPLPEVSDRELEDLARHLPVDPTKRSIAGFSLRTLCVTMAITAQWTYFAAQECMSSFWTYLMNSFVRASAATSVISSSSSANLTDPLAVVNTFQPLPGLSLSIADYLLVANSAFALSRFVAGALAYLSARHPRSRLIPSPRTMLLCTTLLSLSAAIVITAMRPPQANPNLIFIPTAIFYYAGGPIWPLVFAMGLRGQGRRTKRVSAFLVMGASGPAFWPFVMYGIVRQGAQVHSAFVIIIALQVVTLAYPALLLAVRDAKVMTSVESRTQMAKGARGGE